MGKKYIPVKVNGLSYKVYLDNIEKIYKNTSKTSVPIPPFHKKLVSRKSSLETCPDCEPYFDINAGQF